MGLVGMPSASLKHARASRGASMRSGSGSASQPKPGSVEALSGAYSMPSGPCASPDRNCLTNWLSELKSSAAGPDSTILPFQRIAMYSATRRARHDVVRDDDVGAAVLLVDLLDQLAEERGAHRVEARVGLVEEHDLRVEHQRPREARALAHAARELVRHLVAGAAEADFLQAPVDDVARSRPRPCRCAGAAGRRRCPRGSSSRTARRPGTGRRTSCASRTARRRPCSAPTRRARARRPRRGRAGRPCA